MGGDQGDDKHVGEHVDRRVGKHGDQGDQGDDRHGDQYSSFPVKPLPPDPRGGAEPPRTDPSGTEASMPHLHAGPGAPPPLDGVAPLDEEAEDERFEPL